MIVEELGFPGGSDGKESTCSAGDLGLIPGLERLPGGGHGGLQSPESPWQATVRGVAESNMTERLNTAHSTSNSCR